MALHRFILHPLSAWGTPLRSDTLTGLLLYRLAEDESEKALQTELEAFESGEPPFRLSSAMPEGSVFAPRLPPTNRETFARLAENGCFPTATGEPASLFEALGLYKIFRKHSFLPLEIWEKHRSSLSASGLFMEYCNRPDLWNIHSSKSFQETHVSMSRHSGSAQDGGLFSTTAFQAVPGTAFHLYADTEDCPHLLDRLARIGQLGYGKDSSTGKGVFSIEVDRNFQPDKKFATLPHGLLLSILSAQNLKGLAGWYSTEMKTGKAGPAFCKGNPFKSPFLCIKEGAVLISLPPGGFVLHNIHANPAIVQITQPLTLPCRLAEGEESHAC